MSLQSSPIILENENWYIALNPYHGGSMIAANWCGQDVLRPGHGPDPRAMAGFPLFPFSGRIDSGRFDWGGRAYSLPPNMPPEPHAIHGQGWQSIWQVEPSASDQSCLSYTHEGDIWPWPYKAEQVITLAANRLEWHGYLTNLGANTMPAGLGWHPYFPRAGATIKANIDRIWHTEKNMIPDRPCALGELEVLREGFAPDDFALDYAFVRNAEDHSSPVATIQYAEYEVNIFADPIFCTLIIFTPPDQAFFCVEPVTHAPNAVNMPDPFRYSGLKLLEPNDKIHGKICLSLSSKTA